MTERIAVNPDLSFVHALLGAGAEDLNLCYQCSTCTVVCPVTPDGSPFPRKEMVQAQFGLKDKLVRSLDAWLCIHCNDCSTYCPRGAKPGDVMNTIRALSVEHFAVPGALARAAANPARIWILFLIPVLILGAAIFALHGSGFGFMEGRIVFSKMFPVPVVDGIFIPAAAFAGITLVLGLLKFMTAIRTEYPRSKEGQSLGAAIAGTMTDIVTHRRFRDCGTNPRAHAHMAMMYGFIGLFITTNLVGIMYYLDQFGMDVQVTPYDFFHPIKLVGNVSGSLALLGCTIFVARRMSGGTTGKATVFDWTFLWALFFTILTGFLAQVFRVFDVAAPAYFIYFIHLVFVFFLLAYAAYTKMGHMFYRLFAMVYARYSGRAVLNPAAIQTTAIQAAAD